MCLAGDVHGGTRDVVRDEELDPFGPGPRTEDLLQLEAELVIAVVVVGVGPPGPPVEEVHPVDGRAEVLPEPGLGRHQEDDAVGGVVVLVAHVAAG